MRTCLLGLLVAATAAGLVSAQAGGDAEKMVGTWTVVSALEGGRPKPEEQTKGVKLIITKDRISVLQEGQEKDAVTYALDPAKKPAWIDIMPGDRKLVGIYDLKGDDLKICFNEKGSERPMKFESRADSPSEVLIVLKRDKK